MFSNLQAGPQTEDSYEFLSSATFWALGVVIVLNSYWVNQQIVRFQRIQDEHDGSSEDTANTPQAALDPVTDASSGPGSPASLSTTVPNTRNKPLWLQPHITSRPRKVLAVALCGLALPLQLLEGSWVLRTAWRVTVATHHATYAASRPAFIRFIMYLPGLVAGLAAWTIVLGAGLFFIFGQLTLVFQLAEVDTVSPLRPKGSKAKSHRKQD